MQATQTAWFRTTTSRALETLWGTRYIVAAFLAVGAAFQYSLRSLFLGVMITSPLRSLGLIPLVALVVLAARARRHPLESSINDRELDWVVGLPLILAAVAIQLLGPAHWSALYWSWRLDMVSLLFFAAGTVALLFGTRALWRVRAAIVLMVLAWPLPLKILLARFLEDVTRLTSVVMTGMLPWIFRHSVGLIVDSDAFLSGLDVESAVPDRFAVAASAVMFAVGGGAFVALAFGRWYAKATWWLLGIVLAPTIDGLVRLTGSAAAHQIRALPIGEPWQYHELVALTSTLLVMGLLAPLFGFRVAREDTPERIAFGGSSSTFSRARPKGANLAVAISAAAMLGVTNGGLERFSSVAGPFGEPRLPSFEGSGAAPVPEGWRLTGVPSGWKSGQPTEVTLRQQLFGPSATWYRFRYSQEPQRGVTGRSQPFSASVDVVTTPKSRSLAMQGLEEAYGFMQYEVVESQNVELTSGVKGTALVHESIRGKGRWATLHWILPVHTVAADLYERVVLVADIGNSGSLVFSDQVIRRLVSLGRALVAEQMANRDVG